MKKRILVLHNGYPMLSDSGDKTRTISMLRSLCKDTDELFFLAFYKRGGRFVNRERSKLPGNVTSFFFYTLPDRFPFFRFSLFLRSIITWWVVRCNHIDIIQAETSLSAKSTMFVRGKVKLITDFHADPVPELSLNNASVSAINNAENDITYALKNSDSIIAVSETLYKNLSKKQDNNLPVSILPCCFNAELFESVEQKKIEQLKEEYGLSNRIVLCYLGGLHKWQCVEETILLFLKLRKLNPDYFLCLYTNDDISIYADLLKEAEGHYLCKSLKHTDVPLYLSIVDVGFVLRSDSLVNINASPTKTSEYMAAGAMVVTTRYAGDAPEIINACGYGVVLDEVEIEKEDILNVLNSSIHLFVENKPQSSQQVRQYAFEHRVWQSNEQKLKVLYNTI